MQIMELMMNNWFLVIIGICLICILIIFIKNLLSAPTDVQVKVIKEFIYMLILNAEKELGSSTGQAKLAMVIKEFYSTCPIDLRSLIPEQMILEFIEEGVERMKKYFENDSVVKQNILKLGDVK